MSSADNYRIPELDGLRGIAIGMVVLFHYFFLTLNPVPGSALAYVLAIGRLTWTGVDLFFVLSGFLIGGILIDARGSSNYFLVFYTRRFYRILPLYAVWLSVVQLLVLAIHLKIVSLPGFLDDRLPVFPYIVFLQNFWMAAKNTFGGSTSGGSWSLAIEEQFYLTIPAVIWIVDLRKRPWVILVGIVGAPLLRILCWTLFTQHPWAPFFLMPCRADALLFGVFGAILWRDKHWRDLIQANPGYLKAPLLILLLGSALFTIHASPLTGLWMVSIGYTWMAALYLSLLLYAITQPKSRLSACLRFKWLMGVGTIAYGVYLFHSYVLIFVRQIIHFPQSNGIFIQLLASIVAIPLTLMLCRMSYVYFEKPLISAGHKLRYLKNSQVKN